VDHPSKWKVRLGAVQLNVSGSDQPEVDVFFFAPQRRTLLEELPGRTTAGARLRRDRGCLRTTAILPFQLRFGAAACVSMREFRFETTSKTAGQREWSG
jgi:hypothetical protein